MFTITRLAYNVWKVRCNVAILTINPRKGPPIKVKIDREDYERVKNMGNWKIQRGRNSKDYISYQINPRKVVMLHRFIMNTPDHMTCSFRSSNSFDCRKENLMNDKFMHLAAKSGHPYVYEVVDRQGLFVAVYDPPAKRERYVGKAYSMESAIQMQKEYLEKHPRCRVPGMDME